MPIWGVLMGILAVLGRIALQTTLIVARTGTVVALRTGSVLKTIFVNRIGMCFLGGASGIVGALVAEILIFGQSRRLQMVGLAMSLADIYRSFTEDQKAAFKNKMPTDILEEIKEILKKEGYTPVGTLPLRTIEPGQLPRPATDLRSEQAQDIVDKAIGERLLRILSDPDLQLEMELTPDAKVNEWADQQERDKPEEYKAAMDRMKEIFREQIGGTPLTDLEARKMMYGYMRGQRLTNNPAWFK